MKNLNEFTGKNINDSMLDKIANLVQSQAKPMRTTTVNPWYRRRVIGVIERRLTKKLFDAS